MTTYKHDTIVPFTNSQKGKKKQVEEMFDDIAFKYDFLNRILSGGIDITWRKKAIRQLKDLNPKNILDVATGTADVAILSWKILKPDKITGIDLSEGMMSLGRHKIKKLGLQDHIQLEKGDSETISFDDNSFDAVTVVFGVRNFENLEKGLEEIKRVLKPGGRLVVLEFSHPTMPVIRQLCNFYMNVIMPGFGKLFSNNKEAYTYLNKSVENFPEGKTFVGILNKSGYKNTSLKKLSLGVCSIYTGEK
ncbi:bifunctional demethylmenaquinone methyltransferase/2-methoxy-6-polyprenyl-1,4-benzoquinol methylase UbiE [soil metagenome]